MVTPVCFSAKTFVALFASQKGGLFLKERILPIKNSENAEGKQETALSEANSLLYQLIHMEKVTEFLPLKQYLFTLKCDL